MKDRSKYILLWAFFLISSIAATIISLLYSGVETRENIWFFFTTDILPFTAVCLHSFYMLGMKKGVLFMFLAFSISSIFETAGVNLGVVFGGNYSYSIFGPDIAGVPIVIPMFWFVFTYSVYGLLTSAVYRNQNALPDLKNRNKPLLFKLIFLDAVLVTMIDLVMDPVMVKWGQWTWTRDGWYFGIPAMNFVGWFIVVLMVSAMFRTYEYYHPRNRFREKSSLNLIPNIGYLMIFLTFTALAFKEGILPLGFISIFAYLPFIFTLMFKLGKTPKV